MWSTNHDWDLFRQQGELFNSIHFVLELCMLAQLHVYVFLRLICGERFVGISPHIVEHVSVLLIIWLYCLLSLLVVFQAFSSLSIL